MNRVESVATRARGVPLCGTLWAQLRSKAEGPQRGDLAEPGRPSAGAFLWRNRAKRRRRNAPLPEGLRSVCSVPAKSGMSRNEREVEGFPPRLGMGESTKLRGKTIEVFSFFRCCGGIHHLLLTIVSRSDE